MFRALLTACLAVFLFATPAIPAKDFSHLLNAVRPLQTSPDGGVFCTATQINKTKKFWLTAAHCVAGERALFIGDAPAYVTETTAIEGEGDMAILFSPTSTAPDDLKLSRRVLRQGERIRIMGFPAGVGPIVTQGFVGNPLVYFPYYDEWLASFDVSVCGGNSGSAVVNSRDEVVSVLTRYHYPVPPCMALAGGTPLSKLIAFAGKYFRR